LEDVPGMIVLGLSGSGDFDMVRHEAGGHRWQRVPPTEKRGRVQSSTVTVAVFKEKPRSSFSLKESDLEITTCRGSGPGGQHRNKTDTAVQVKHKPTGMIVRSESERSQSTNKEQALSLLASRLEAAQESKASAAERSARQRMIGSGERSDKIRTVQVQNNQVVNHVTGQRIPVERYLKGELPV
jgi:peptide chain release factor 1